MTFIPTDIISSNEVRYVWELYDADDLMVASGDHPDLASACREAAHYYNQYAQDGPHRYTVEQRTVVMTATYALDADQ